MKLLRWIIHMRLSWGLRGSGDRLTGFAARLFAAAQRHQAAADRLYPPTERMPS